jgi:hypothetical protein
MLSPPRYDFTFSYWILAWFFLYYNKIVTYNPKIWLLLGLVHNIITIIVMFYYQNSFLYMFLFTIINIIIKIIPLWLIRKTRFNEDDFWFGAGLFIVHLYWLYVNKSSYPQFLKDGLKRIRQNKPVGPTEYYICKYLGISPRSVRFT